MKYSSCRTPPKLPGAKHRENTFSICSSLAPFRDLKNGGERRAHRKFEIRERCIFLFLSKICFCLKTHRVREKRSNDRTKNCVSRCVALRCLPNIPPSRIL